MADPVMTCGQCGQPAAAGDRFCGDCGAELPPPRRFCTNCGAENPGGAHFCASCGTGLAASPPPGGQRPAGPQANPAPAGPPPAAVPAPEPEVAAPSGFSVSQPVALLGAVVAGVGALLAWFDFAGVTTSAFDVPALYLLDFETASGTTISVGLLVVLLAAATVLACLVPGFGQRETVVRLLGSGVLAIVVLFGVQLARTADAFGGSFTDFIGIGPIVCAVGAAAVLSGR